ncbi:MAG TPA: hypothetical protein VGA51_17375 [Casimicrobiaceae bacterium]
MIAENDGQPGHAFAPNQSDLDLLVARLDGDDGREAAVREIDGIDSAVGLFEALAKRQGHDLEARLQHIKVVGGK